MVCCTLIIYGKREEVDFATIGELMSVLQVDWPPDGGTLWYLGRRIDTHPKETPVQDGGVYIFAPAKNGEGFSVRYLVVT
jgi:hypothetical protein